jgi:hypothetical protein
MEFPDCQRRRAGQRDAFQQWLARDLHG